jgi:filamentous hemagglutinin
LSAGAAKGIAQGVTALTAAGVGAVVGGAQGAATALTVDANNRALHTTDRQLSTMLAAKGKYSKEQIEEQMRLMGNAALGVGPNTTERLIIIDEKTKNLSEDPRMPKLISSTAIVELPGQANTEIQQYIIANTKDGSGFIPGQSPYAASNTSSNAPTTTNTPPATQTQTASCANSDLACRSGVGVQQNAPLTQQTREAIADGASTLSRQAGVIAAGAVAVSSQAGPYGQSAKAVAVGATVIGVGADVVEQVMKPNVGQTSANLLGFGVGVSIEPLPGGKIVAPLTNEIIEAVKNSSTVQSISTRINEFLNPSTEAVKK